MTSEITIRKGQERDLGHVLNLIREFAQFQGTPEKVMITLDQMKVDRD